MPGVGVPLAAAAGPAFPWLAGANVFSSILGSRGRGKRTRARWGREDTAIQRRVNDAKLAGVHPLFALGGATGGSSAAQAPSGNIVGNALRELARAKENQGRAAQSSLVDRALIESSEASTRLASARADTVEWQLANSINKRNEVNSNSQQDGPVNLEPVKRFIPRKDTPHRLPGVQPAWTNHQIYSDLKIRAPAQEISEVFESIAMWPMIYEENYKEINAWIHRAQGRNWKALKKRHPAYKFMRWAAKKSSRVRKPIAYPMEVSP